RSTFMQTPSLRLVPFAAFVVLFSQFIFAQGYPTPKDTRSAENMPTAAELKDPPKSWIDPDTGHRIVRLTDEPGSASFYFNVNSYTPDGREMVYTTREGISVLDLKTFKTRPVVRGRVFAIVVGHKTPSVFYIKPEEHALYVTNVDTGATRKLVTLPPHVFVSTINAD